jgi:hypothetical protein
MPRFTRARTACLAGVAAIATLGVFVSTSAGSSSSRSATHHAAAFKAVRSRSVTGGYVYVASNVITLAAHKSAGGTIKCPAKAPHPISGEFNESTGHVFLAASFESSGGWDSLLTNSAATSAKVQIGAVCAP